jgi:hypothetical protein
MKDVIIYCEGKDDVAFFQTLLNCQLFSFVDMKGKTNIDTFIKIHNQTPESKNKKMLFIVDADYEWLDTGYEKTDKLMKSYQKKHSNLIYYIATNENGKDGMLEDVILDAIIKNNDIKSQITCFDKFIELDTCHKISKVHSRYRKALWSYFIGCYKKQDYALNKNIDLIVEMQKSDRCRKIKQDLQQLLC